MPLMSAEPPASADSVLRESIQTLVGERRVTTPLLRGAAPEGLELTDPHETYVLGLSDLIASPDLSRAQPTGWRYLVRSAGEPVAAAHSAETAAGEHVLSQVNEGPFVGATASALTAAAGSEGSYVPRVLNIPALHAVALWLHNGGDGDLLVPLAPFPLDVPTGQPMPAAELLSLLASSAGPVVETADDDMKGS
jgi:hypothetical protein